MLGLIPKQPWAAPECRACCRGHLACLHALLAVGAGANAVNDRGYTPLHTVAMFGHTACAAAFLAAGADPGAVSNATTALQSAVYQGHPALVRLLVEAAPQAALPVAPIMLMAVALLSRDFASARFLLELGALPPAGKLLELMQTVWHRMLPPHASEALRVYAPLVARLPLTLAERGQVLDSCPSLGAALPAVLRRSEAEAGQLVRCLPPADQERLRTAALCLACTQHLTGPAMPADNVLLLVFAVVAE